MTCTSRACDGSRTMRTVAMFSQIHFITSSARVTSSAVSLARSAACNKRGNPRGSSSADSIISFSFLWPGVIQVGFFCANSHRVKVEVEALVLLITEIVALRGELDDFAFRQLHVANPHRKGVAYDRGAVGALNGESP